MLKIIYKTPIYKGYSEDKKYCITAEDHHQYLMRISPITQKEQKLKEFEIMKRLSELKIPMCLPIETGLCEDGFYSIYSWIDGTDAELILPDLSYNEQFSTGLEAGKILKKIHEFPAPLNTENWDIYFNRKIDRKIKMYEDCDLKYKNGQLFIDYIQAHRFLLKNRPNTFQHGDYHIGNMMIDRCKKLIIIDFNRFSFGDPWEEFNRIVWCAQKSPAFAKGMIDGYFDFAVPEEFWKLLALYISSNTLGSLPWAIPFGQKQVEIMMQQAEEVLEWFDYFKEIIPCWYKENL